MAGEYIPKGKIVWVFQENFDLCISDEEFERLPEKAKEHISIYGYLSELEGGYILCMDNAKYTNHSSEPNMQMVDKFHSIAIRDIKEGEEITEDYFYFDELAHQKLTAI